MRRSVRQLGKGPVAPAGREGATTRASSSRSMADDDPEPRMDDDECLATDGSFSTRFSATRLCQIADRQPKNKKDVIRLCNFGSLLNINSFSVPADLLDWVVMKIDPDKSLFRNKLSLDKIDFGKRNLRRLAETPYVRLDGCSEIRHQNNKFVHTDAHIPDIPSNPSFDGSNATATSSNDHMPEDVTFHAPVGNATDVDHTRDPIHTSPEAHKSPVPQEVDADKEVVDPDVADEGQNVILSHDTMAALQGLALEFDDGPSMSMFKEGTEDFEWLNMDDDTARNPDFIEIEGFQTSLENFHASLKPRAEIDSDIMTLYLKTFNLEQTYNRKKPKKFAFCVFMGSQLVVDPGLFNPKSCEREFRRACKNNQITKSDLLFIVVVQNKHWVVVVANLMHKQFNVFDSIKNSEDVTLLTNATNNVTYIPNLRKQIASNLLKHPSNNLDPAEQLGKLLEV
ncbi:hypothetical protein D1007_29774 [Hordeum vulgare]|nr:hypothetical protein D1007_29774 [Hordeum vulgare]